MTLTVAAQEAAAGHCFLEGAFPSLIVHLHRAEHAAGGKLRGVRGEQGGVVDVEGSSQPSKTTLQRGIIVVGLVRPGMVLALSAAAQS